MIINYLTLAARLLIRNPLFTFINLVCLSVGFAMFFMLWQHAATELRSDQYHKDFDRIVRVGVTWNWTDDGANWQQAKYGGFGARGIEKLITDFGDFEEGLEIYNQGMIQSPIFGHANDIYITVINDKNEKSHFAETNVAYADSNLFHFFSIPLIRGNASTVLNGLRATVLSQTIAKKYFGAENPVGRVIYLNDSLPLTVTGVFKDLPSNTHLNFSIAISTLHLGLEKINSFQLTHAYLRLKKNIAIASLQPKLAKYVKTIFGGMMEARKGNLKVELFLQQLKDIAFASLTWDRFTTKSKHFLVIIGILSVVILAMAWVNYVNLSRANNQQRLKELGARKSVGATTNDFIKQFLLESTLINFISFFAALTLIQILRSPAEVLFQFHVAKWTEIDLLSWVIVLAVLVSGILITGLYPAWSTIRATPKVLFGKSRRSNNQSRLTKVLTTLQYSSTIVLIVWVMSINLQLNFIFRKDIGINRENVVIIELPIKRTPNFESSLSYFIKQNELSPALAGVTTSSCVVGDAFMYSMNVKRRGGVAEPAVDSNGGVDENFIPFYGIKLIAGRNFSPSNAADKNAIVLSRIATARMGFLKPEDALGVELENPSAHVIGIIDDYAVKPLLSEYGSSIHGVRGIALSYGNTIHGLPKKKVAVKIKSGMIDEGMASLQKTYAEAFPETPFQSYFLDNHINQYYNGERLFLQQISLFTGIAMFIACLGLLGMMRIKVLEFAKEIAIRKVLGAKLHQLSKLLLTPALRQVAIAAIIGLPISHYLNMEYLQKFSERVTLAWWQYLIPVAIFLVLMFASIASLIIQAAKANPVDALHHE